MATSKKELEILNRVKEEIFELPAFLIDKKSGDYLLRISSEDWHKIFKTEEYNERFR